LKYQYSIFNVQSKYLEALQITAHQTVSLRVYDRRVGDYERKLGEVIDPEGDRKTTGS
jgi:hypothetical protein